MIRVRNVQNVLVISGCWKTISYEKFIVQCDTVKWDGYISYIRDTCYRATNEALSSVPWRRCCHRVCHSELCGRGAGVLGGQSDGRLINIVSGNCLISQHSKPAALWLIFEGFTVTLYIIIQPTNRARSYNVCIFPIYNVMVSRQRCQVAVIVFVEFNKEIVLLS